MARAFYYWQSVKDTIAERLSASAIFGFLLAVIFDPFTWTGATTPRWALLAVGLPLLLRLSAPNHFTLAHLVGILFALWTALTITWTANIWDGAGQLLILLIIVQAFIYGEKSLKLEKIFIGLAVGISASSLILIIPPLHTLPSIVLVYPHGLFGNRNMLGEIAALTLVGCVVYRLYWFIPGLLPALLWPPIARDALLAVAAGLILWIWPKHRTIALVCIALGIIALYFGIEYRPSSVEERFTAWSAVLNNLTFFGHGIGSLYTLSPYMTDAWDTTARRLDHAHNEFLEILFEQGIPGLVLYTALLSLAYRSADWATRSILSAFLVISCVAFPWRIPANAFVGALCLGHAVRNGRPLRDEYHAWRTYVRAWLGSHWTGFQWQHQRIAMGEDIKPV